MKKKFGIDKYIEIDETDEGKLREINMTIPMSKLMNPEENKKLRENEETYEEP